MGTRGLGDKALPVWATMRAQDITGPVGQRSSNVSDQNRRPDPHPADGASTDQTMKWSITQPNESAAGGGFGSDPWTDYPSAEDSPAPSRANWTLIVGAGVSAIALLAGLFLLTRSAASDMQSVTPDPTLPLDGQRANSPGAESTFSVVSSVVINQTVAPTACLGGDTADGALQRFLNAALAQQGVRYEFGAEVAESEANPAAFDSSELVQWSALKAGVAMADGSWIQYLALEGCGGDVAVPEALATPGALVFGFPAEPIAGGERPAGSFVAISLGDGRVIDVAAPEVTVRTAEEMQASRSLTHAALIPDLGMGTAQYSP